MATANGAEPPRAGVTEDEAALYDRQIRLWGLEAQNRMRSAHVLIAPLTGVATEVVKNIVLSGIGRLTIADGTSVSEEDLGAGFFFRADDVGSPRAAAAPLQRIQQLNPLVQLQGITERDALADEALVEELRPDVVLACAGEREALVKLNAACRRTGARFYATRAQGLGGFLFSDLGERYEYVTERSERGSTEKKKALWRQAFVPLASSLRVSWNRARLQPGEVLGAPVRQWSAGLWALWASWELGAEARSSPEAYAAALEQTAQRLLDAKGVDARSVFEKRGVDRATFFRAYAEATCAEHAAEFAPTCAVLGGILAQDLLNALSQREEPIVNWCVLDAARGLAQIHAIGTPAAEALAAPSDTAH